MFYFRFFSLIFFFCRLANCPSAKVFNFYQKISRAAAAAVFNEIFSLSCKGLALKFA